MFKTVDLSLNAKTGPMPAVYGSKQLCPLSCALYDECYGKQGHTNIHFNAAANGIDFDSMLAWIKKLPMDIWRLWVTGDFPHNDGMVDREKVLAMAAANKKRKLIAYSHHLPTDHNLSVFQDAKKAGFHVNISCDTIADIQKTVKAGLSAVTYTSANDTRKKWHEHGLDFVTCPNQSSSKKPTCRNCKLCAKSRDYVIVFRAHASKKSTIVPVV
jgi:hypothetical protein